MAEYRLARLDLASRLQLTLAMLTPRAVRGWGRVTALAAEQPVLRSLLYALRDRGQDALLTALAPQPPGSRRPVTPVTVDAAFRTRTVASLATPRGTVRGIQQGLALLFQPPRAVGAISQTLTALGARAAADHAASTVPRPVLAEAAESFQGRPPGLTVVAGRCFLVRHLAPAAARDGTTWGVTFLDLPARGIQFQDLASAAAAPWAVPLRRDLLHRLQDAWRVGRGLERQA